MGDEVEMNKIWRAVLEGLRLQLSEGTFIAYIKSATLAEVKEVGEKMVCEVEVGSAMIRDTIDQRFRGQITKELERVMKKSCEVVLKIQNQGERETGSKSDLGPLFEEKKGKGDEWKKAKLRDDYTFADYAVGGSNQMAHAAALAVVRQPGSAYNPLFIYGGVGVGKTHLMQGIGHAIIEKGEDRMLFCTSEQFTNDLVEGIKNKTTDRVRTKYRRLKLLMIDDVQFIAGKGSAQEEFFHTFNEILAGGGQVIMTSDKPPAEIPKLESRLKSRFGAGLIVEITLPDWELRTAILLIKARQKGLILETAMAQKIAEKIEGVRELEGFVVRMLVEMGGKIDEEEIEKVLKLKKTGNGVVKVVTPVDVINGVSHFYGVGVQLLKGEKRTKTIAWPRQILMHILAHDLRLPLVEVGRLLGGRDHTTVIHARDKVREEAERNPKFKVELGEIKKRIFSGTSYG